MLDLSKMDFYGRKVNGYAIGEELKNPKEIIIYGLGDCFGNYRDKICFGYYFDYYWERYLFEIERGHLWNEIIEWNNIEIE